MENNKKQIQDHRVDAHLFHEGTHYRCYSFLGAHKKNKKVQFTVWAPRAKAVYLIGDFTGWKDPGLPMERLDDSGLWRISLEGVKVYDNYKYRIETVHGEIRYKADPFAFHAEERPRTASKFFSIGGYKWNDGKYMRARKKGNPQTSPINIYEANLLSWKKNEDGKPLSYREFAEEMIPYLKKTGYTHIELMPLMEHPFDGSWGYQVTGYYAPTSRYGTPYDFMAMIDSFHQHGIGVILDWVPVHFCKDDFGLARFDGTYLYESLDQQKSDNMDWGTLNFDYLKPEVVSFLISNAIYWLEEYHIDGLRVDAVAYMLYRDYGRRGETEHNKEGISFIKKLNKVVHEQVPDALMIAEESTAWPHVTGSVENEGLGFDFKWNMGWMNDILAYMETDPIYRKYNQKALTFPMVYAYSEKYILPFSHDEVVHGKKSMLDKMPGKYEQKFDNLRLLYTYTMAMPGKKLLFMGGEFGQFIEWNEWKSLDWHLLEYPHHERLFGFVKELNKLYLEQPALYEVDDSFEGFEWIEHENHQESIIAFERIAKNGNRIICLFNFTPVSRTIYPIGVKDKGAYKTLFLSAHRRYGGSIPRVKRYKSVEEEHHGRDYTIRVELPGLSGQLLVLDDKK
ncbi:MAG: 1,4-alpha-glucan branching protein GlgB [Tissierellia bacterium]|nr:1,4-alpha-glucan branching protein GlgB [Tissierellia bacterium]